VGSHVILPGGYGSDHLLLFSFLHVIATFRTAEFYTCLTPPEVNRGRPSIGDGSPRMVNSVAVMRQPVVVI
jgi:hypothetical protein